MALIPAKGEPRVLVSVTARDMPAMRTMTYVKEVFSGWEWKHFESFLEKLPAGGKLATIGFDLITPLLFGQVEKSIEGKFSLVGADNVLAAAREKQRPRETAMIRIAAQAAAAARKEFLGAWRAGKDIENAALTGERAARDRAAQDVRTLVSRDGGRTLEPYRAKFDDRPAHLLGYVAVKYQAYWADAFVTTGGRDVAARAKAALDAVLALMKPGASPDALWAAARGALGPHALHPVLSGSLGHRIGLSPNEGLELRPGGAPVAADVAYAIRVGAHDEKEGGAIASAVVHVHADGKIEILLRSDPE
jgi:Xaa-Pro aminopeptidase